MLVEAKAVTKVFETRGVETQALRGVDLEIGPGEFMALAGPSGSGKTTLLNLLGALDRPTTGEIWLDGQNLADLSSTELSELRLHKLGFVFQAYNLIPVFTAAENVEFVLELQGVAAAERRERATALLGEVGLGGLESKHPLEMSGGQQQRVAVARAIASEPRLVLADEPTANLDSATAEKLVALMRELNRERGVTFLFSTHDPLVMEAADRLVRLKDGVVVADERRAG
ncbi:MAG: ABC transporter ATP-binding protein [Proteobacteria bacterium]|nr:ABC transporter ATP-binding protein [Pseudomonadota bacterium]